MCYRFGWRMKTCCRLQTGNIDPGTTCSAALSWDKDLPASCSQGNRCLCTILGCRSINRERKEHRSLTQCMNMWPQPVMLQLWLRPHSFRYSYSCTGLMSRDGTCYERLVKIIPFAFSNWCSQYFSGLRATSSTKGLLGYRLANRRFGVVMFQKLHKFALGIVFNSLIDVGCYRKKGRGWADHNNPQQLINNHFSWVWM